MAVSREGTVADMEVDVVGMEEDMVEVSSEDTEADMVVAMAAAMEAAMAVAMEAQEVVVEEVMVEGTRLTKHRRNGYSILALLCFHQISRRHFQFLTQ